MKYIIVIFLLLSSSISTHAQDTPHSKKRGNFSLDEATQETIKTLSEDLKEVSENIRSTAEALKHSTHTLDIPQSTHETLNQATQNLLQTAEHISNIKITVHADSLNTVIKKGTAGGVLLISTTALLFSLSQAGISGKETASAIAAGTSALTGLLSLWYLSSGNDRTPPESESERPQ